MRTPICTLSAECKTAGEAATHVARITPQVLVMDPALPDASGFETCRRMREQRPGLRVVMLLARVDEHTASAAVQAGATAVLSKRAPLSEIGAAVQNAAAGVVRLDRPATAALFEHVRGDGGSRSREALTELEGRVLGRLVAGGTNKEIAHEPDISEKTVKSHLSKAFTKLHVTRRTRAAVLFLADGWASSGCSEVFRIAGDLHHP